MNFTALATTESASPAIGTTLRIERPAPTNSPWKSWPMASRMSVTPKTPLAMFPASQATESRWQKPKSSPQIDPRAKWVA
jgi:hypothetical protein